MPVYGAQIGKKFAINGQALPYPGNTVISDVCPDNPAYGVMSQCRALLLSSALAPHYIPLPESSYHTTVIRGVNHLVRQADFWPPHLPLETPFDAMDDWFQKGVLSVPNPGPFSMRFARARINEEDFRIQLLPADESSSAALSRYRDQVADALYLRLPGHDAYTFHITLAYTLTLPQDAEKDALFAIEADINNLLSRQGAFTVDAPHVAFYHDMLEFYPDRICRTL